MKTTDKSCVLGDGMELVEWCGQQIEYMDSGDADMLDLHRLSAYLKFIKHSELYNIQKTAFPIKLNTLVQWVDNPQVCYRIAEARFTWKVCLDCAQEFDYYEYRLQTLYAPGKPSRLLDEWINPDDLQEIK